MTTFVYRDMAMLSKCIKPTYYGHLKLVDQSNNDRYQRWHSGADLQGAGGQLPP